jgi:hypothetical protein
MKWKSRREFMRGLPGTLAVFFLGSRNIAAISLWPRRAALDIPVSLAVGTIRTPAFAVKHETYLIMIRAEKRLPFAQMCCMMGLTTGPLDPYNCDEEPLLQADWTVWDEGHVVAEGSFHKRGGGGYAEHDLYQFLGHFVGKSRRKYVLELRFTKDGTPLNVTNPRLIVDVPTD